MEVYHMITAIATPTPDRPDKQTSAKLIPSVAAPIEQCAWCWPLLHPGKPYPEQWSSTICAAHSAWVLLQAAARRRAMRGNAR